MHAGIRGSRSPLAGVLLLGCAPAFALPDYSAGDFGSVGLMQMPTARFAPDGEMRFGVSSFSPYNQLFASLQFLPWLEATFRYTEITNRLYGPEDFSGNQSYKDKGVDFRMLLHPESEYLPALALGVADVGGTGLFASEYLVASRRYYDLDFTLGLAWGRAGTRGGIDNPLASLSDRFRVREQPRVGAIGGERLFRGEEVGLFGGLQWQTPLRGLSLKLEYDGNDYQSEALDNPQNVDSPINAALNYRVWDRLDLSAGIERGDTFMFRVALHTNLMRARGPAKVFDPPSTPAYRAQAARSGAPLRQSEAFDQAFVDALRGELARQKIELAGVSADDARGLITLWFTQSLSNNQPLVLKRIGRSLAVLAPPPYQAFTLVHVNGDHESYRVTVLRKQIEDDIDFRGSPEELAATAWLDPPQRPPLKDAAYRAPPAHPRFDWNMGPALRQHIGGPDDFYLAQLWWRLAANLQITPRWSLGTVLGANLYNNFDKLENRDFSQLQNVRSDIAQYLIEGENNLIRLETNYIFSPASHWLARVSAGLFEEMYGGVAGEVLYRRAYSPWAVGLNVNRVRQRDYDQRFDFLDYEVTTGHLTGYFDLPFYALHMNLSYGRYLAGDWGSTLELSRSFDSGVVIGAFATKTNVSAAEFGEGSFDKGFFLYMPLDLFFTRSTRKGSYFVFRPLTRDGGQKVRDGAWLYGVSENGHFDPRESWGATLR